MVDLIDSFKQVKETFQIKFCASCPDFDRLFPSVLFLAEKKITGNNLKTLNIIR